MLHTANNNKDVFRGHGHTKTRVKTTIVDVALPWKSSALITLNERDHCVLQRFTFEEFHDFYFKRGIQEPILKVWILKCSHICFTKCVYCTEDGRSTSVFLLYWQLSQGWMADFPAFIASKSFDLWNHHIPQMKWHNLWHILMNKNIP